MNPNQTSMTFTWHEALQEDVTALGGRKRLAPRLWPSEDEETANDRLKAALSPGHKQELKPSEVLKIKEWAHAEKGSHALVNYEAQLLGQRVEWIEPEDEMTRLLRDYLSSKRQNEARDARLERVIERMLTEKPHLRSVG